jgi:hypothetical protein
MKLMVWLEREVNNFMEKNKGPLKRGFLNLNITPTKAPNLPSFLRLLKLLKF